MSLAKHAKTTVRTQGVLLQSEPCPRVIAFSQERAMPANILMGLHICMLRHGNPGREIFSAC